MTVLSRNRVERHYAGVQSAFWTAFCVYNSFTALLLGAKGFSDWQVGLTTALVALASIAFQLFIASYSDRHLHIPLRKIITTLYAMGMICAALVAAVPLAAALLMMVYALGGAFQSTVATMLNAHIMQYANAGLEVRIGWPRGVSSLAYALAAYAVGTLMERYSPALLMPLFLGLSAAFIIALWLMPDVDALGARPLFPTPRQDANRPSSYQSMLRASATLRMFLLATVLLVLGQTTNIVFLIRVIQPLGGGSRQLGISMFLQAALEMPMMFISPWLLRRFRPASLLAFSSIFYVLKAAAITWANGMGMIYAAMSLSFFCFGVYGISSVILVNSLVRADEKIRAQGLLGLCGSMGNIIGNLGAGWVMDTWGLRALLYINLLLLAAAALLMFRTRALDRRRGEPASPVQTPVDNL